MDTKYKLIFICVIVILIMLFYIFIADNESHYKVVIHKEKESALSTYKIKGFTKTAQC
jgi:hypothetical protein